MFKYSLTVNRFYRLVRFYVVKSKTNQIKYFLQEKKGMFKCKMFITTNNMSDSLDSVQFYNS